MQPTVDATRTILTLLSEGRSTDAILSQRPELGPADIARAAAHALAALDGAAPSRVESRNERIARMRQTHPRAYAPWTEEEDARLLFRFNEGLSVAEIARALGRQPNAIRLRLEKWLGTEWRAERGHSETNSRT